MQTRREQVQAQRFLTRRVMSALLSGEPENVEQPMRRLGLAVFGSAMIATIVFIGVAVYGLRHPGGAGRPPANTLVIERETGARYVVLADGVLHPVLNYASAQLILGGAGAGASPRVRLMSRSSLVDLPRGPQVGISGAPDALPARSALLGLPWTVCSAPRSADVVTPTTSLYLGEQRALGAGTDLGGSTLLVTDHATGTFHLIRNGLRMKITRPALAVLGLDPDTSVQVGQALLNGIPAGPDLSPSPLPSPTLLSSPPTNAEARQPTICVTYRGESSDRQGGVRRVDQDVTVRVLDRPPSEMTVGTPASKAPEASGGAMTTTRADRVIVPGGRGALVRRLPVSGANTAGTTMYLVTDEGLKYSIPADSSATLAALGYAGAPVTPVPSTLVDLIPSGPMLDPNEARQFSRR